MFNKFLNCFIGTGLMGLSVLSTANLAQAQPNRFFPNPNPGIHRTLIIPHQGRHNQVPSIIPRRTSGYQNPYYPSYNNPYYRKPIHPSQKIIIIERDRPDRIPYYFRENSYNRDHTPYYSRKTPYYRDHTPYYSRKVPYSVNGRPNNRGYASPY